MVKFERFLPITKVDKAEQMVYGWASTPDLDSDGEIITLEAIKNALPAYLQFPTIREMHQPKAAGTTKTADIRDGKDGKGLYIGAKIVSKEAWKLVEEGVYKGFSIGGHVLKRIKNIIHGLELVEISLVDVPANKAAKIEVWKNKKIDLKKDGQGVMVFADLMGHISSCIEYCEYMGKDSKKLKSMLEAVKALVAVEASEAEEYKARAVTYLKHQIASLEKMDLKGERENLIRKGVIMAMKDKVEKLDKKDDESGTVEATEKSEATADKVEAETVEAKTEGEKTEDTTPKTEVDGEKADEAAKPEVKEDSELPTLEKLESINKQLEKIAPEKDVEKLDLQKSVSAMAGTLAKVADIVAGIDARLKKVESTPAAIKSKAAFVSKTLQTEEEKVEDKTEKAASSDELKAKEDRLAELTKMFSKMTPHEFAKRGHSQEAQNLENEIALLKLNRKA